MCWLIPVITTLDIFCWLLIFLKHVFNHGKLNSICEVIWGGPTIPQRHLLLWLFPSAFMWSKFCGMLATVHACSHRVCACDVWEIMWFQVVKSYFHHEFMLFTHTHTPLSPVIPNWGLFLQELLTFVYSFRWLQVSLIIHFHKVSIWIRGSDKERLYCLETRNAKESSESGLREKEILGAREGEGANNRYCLKGTTPEGSGLTNVIKHKFPSFTGCVHVNFLLGVFLSLFFLLPFLHGLCRHCCDCRIIVLCWTKQVTQFPCWCLAHTLHSITL